MHSRIQVDSLHHLGSGLEEAPRVSGTKVLVPRGAPLLEKGIGRSGSKIRFNECDNLVSHFPEHTLDLSVILITILSKEERKQFRIGRLLPD